jgi:hypothetical protein
MSGHNQDREERIRNGFEKTLNSHGYGFQYRIVELVSQLRRQDDPLSAWFFEVAEFPVNIGTGTRMESEYVRTIAIVNAEGIENFLIWSSHLDIG